MHSDGVRDTWDLRALPGLAPPLGHGDRGDAAARCRQPPRRRVRADCETATLMPGIAHVRLDSAEDLLAAREVARTVAAALGLPAVDQARVALAATDLGAADGRPRGRAARRRRAAVPSTSNCPRPRTPSSSSPCSPGAGARRPAGAVPMPAGVPGTGELEALRARAASCAPAPTPHGLRVQDASVVDAFEQLDARQDDLDRLSGELEMTNRGVVALYAELDERGVQLRDANNAKSRFLASVSHELRSPLNSVVALTQLLSAPDSDPLTPAQADQIRLIAESARQLLSLVNGLLDLARAESGALRPDSPQRRPGRAVRGAAFDPAPDHPGHDRARLRRPARRPGRTDAVLLTQVLRNLVGNALKFTDRGRVSVTTILEPGGALRVAVTDTGIGIAPEHQALVFEEFFQVPGPRQVGHRGSGLGLTYCRRVLEALGSPLTLSSRPGLGSTFSFTVPLADTAAPAPAAPLHTVLIADDEAPFRAAVRSTLDGLCDNVLESVDTATTIDALERTRPDLLLLDLRMPGGGGAAVLDWLAAHPTLHTLPVVIVTSLPPAQVAQVRAAATRPVLDKSDLSPTTVARLINLALREGRR